MKLILITIGVFAFAMLGIGIKIWAKKGGEFSGTCASNNPVFNEEGEPCSFCGARPDEKCQKEET